MSPQANPVCTIVGGANGSGKSTLYPSLGAVGEFVNADVVARQMSQADPASMSLAAGRSVLRRLDELTQARQSFVYETTLSGNQPLELMRTARRCSFRVDLVFVVLTSAELHVERVRQRVARGGHNIPESVIRRRYDSAMSRLPIAISLSDECVVFDNSALELAVLARIDAGHVTERSLDESQPTQLRLARILAEMPGL